MNLLTRTPARIWGALATALLCLSIPRAAHAIGETTGQIAGYTFDQTGAQVGGVPLKLSGPSMQGERSTDSGDTDGRFVFLNLPVGDDYTITCDVPGFAGVKIEHLSVVLGQTTSADIHLRAATDDTPAGTIEVVEKVNPILNPDSAQAVAVIDAEKASETPFFHQVEGVAQQVAGVGPGNRPAARGGLARYGKFYVDGLDTTDITDGSITAPMNFDSVQQFEIIVGATDAQYNALGVVTNAVTKTGSNRFTYDVNLTIEPAVLAAQNNYPPLSQAQFGLYTNPVGSPPQTSFYSPVVNFGGPIIKDKLWFYASYQQNFSHKDSPIALPGVTPYNRPTDTTTSLGRIKLTWQATSVDKLSLGLNLDRNVINNTVGNSTVTDAAESKIHRGGEFVLINYDHSFSDSTLFQLQTGFTYKQVNTDPIFSDFTTVNHYDIDTGIDSQNADAINFFTQTGNFLHETKWDLQFNPQLSWSAHAFGTHQLKAGLQIAYQIDSQITGVSGNQRYSDFGYCDPNNTSAGGCHQLTTYYNDQAQEAPLETHAYTLNVGAFIQDKWTVTRRLTLLPGIRADVGYLYGNDHTFIGTLAGLGPRLGLTYDVFGDRKTLFVAHYGRSNDTGNVFIAQHMNPQLEAVTASFSGGAFATCLPALPTSTSAVSSSCTYSGGQNHNWVGHDTALFGSLGKTPYVDEFSTGIHSQLLEETVFGLDYTYRYYGDMWADQEVNRIWNATGTQIVNYADPTKPNQTVFKSGGADSAYRNYNGTDLWIQGTPGRWDLLLSYTLAFTTGTVDDYFDGYLNNPRMTQYYYGYLNADRRHTLKGSVAYKTPFGLDIGFRLEYRTGSPDWESFTNPGDSSQRVYKSPRGTGFPVNYVTGQPNYNDPNSIASLRNPDEALFHLQLRYNLGQALKIKQRLEVTFLLVNALNSVNPVQLYDSNAVKSSKFGLVNFRESPLQAEFIIRYRN
jgi:hypothetical protein